MSIEQVLYRAHAKATGGRDGRAVVPDSNLDVKLTTPKELGGAGGAGANPEQLFAAGYSACFLGAMKFVAARDKITLPADVAMLSTLLTESTTPLKMSFSDAWRTSSPVSGSRRSS